MLPSGWEHVFFQRLRMTVDGRMTSSSTIDMGGGGGSFGWANVLGHGVHMTWTDDGAGVITIARGPIQSADGPVEGEEIRVTTADDPDAIAQQVRERIEAMDRTGGNSDA